MPLKTSAFDRPFGTAASSPTPGVFGGDEFGLRPTDRFGSDRLRKLAFESFQAGGFVPRDTLAMLHAGERIIPAAAERQGAARPMNATVNVSFNIYALDKSGVDEVLKRHGDKFADVAIRKFRSEFNATSSGFGSAVRSSVNLA